MRCVFRPVFLPLVMADLVADEGWHALKGRGEILERTLEPTTPLQGVPPTTVSHREPLAPGYLFARHQLSLSPKQLGDFAAGSFKSGRKLLGELAAGLGHVGATAAAAFDHCRCRFDPGHGVQTALDEVAA